MEKEISNHIVNIPDFPVKGVIFKDISPILGNPLIYKKLIDFWADKIRPLKPTKILAAESRGFLFGPIIALQLNIPFIPIRKKGKLPRATISVEYDLEYGKDQLFIHKDDVSSNDRVIILDDVLATGGTASAMCNLAEKCGASVIACTFLLELGFLNGAKKIESKKIISIIKE